VIIKLILLSVYIKAVLRGGSCRFSDAVPENQFDLYNFLVKI